MKLKIKEDHSSILIYGDKLRAYRFCDQLISLGITPIAIIVNDGLSENCYKGVQVYDNACFPDLSKYEKIQILPTFLYSDVARRDMPILCERYSGEIVRDIEFFARCVLRAELCDPPILQKNPTPDTLIGLQVGFVLGGVETWAANLHHQLLAAGEKVRMLEPLQESNYQYVGPSFYNIDPKSVEQIGQYEDYLQYVYMALERICACPPSVYVDNGSYRLMAAIWLAKKKLHIPIKVVSVLHGDVGIVYNRLDVFQDIIDRIVAVSDPIRDQVVKRMPERANDVVVKIQIPKPCENPPIAHSKDGALRLAYAARLERTNKRSLWLMDVVDGLLEQKVDFTLDVAGDGDCFPILQEYVQKQNLKERVHLLGTLPHEQMDEFWHDKQVFLNFSLSEGGPLTLFESMGHGLVPVVTDAGCGKRLVQSGANGFLIATPQETVEAIAALAADRTHLDTIRQKAWETMIKFYQAEGLLADAFQF